MKMINFMAIGLTLAEVTTDKFTRDHLYLDDPPEDPDAAPPAAGADPVPPKYEFSTQLGCGECISRGYNFCWRIDGVD